MACMTETFRQLSLFDAEIGGYPPAVSLFDQEESPTLPLENWMAQLVPDGEFLVMVGKYPCVLRRTKLKPEEVAKGAEFYHWIVEGAVYSGIFVGADLGDDGEDDGGDEDG